MKTEINTFSKIHLRLCVFISMLLIGFSSKLMAQSFPANYGARSTSMGNTGVGTINAWSSTNNQGALAFSETLSAGFFYENRYLTKALNIQSLALTLPIKTGAFGFNFAYSGFNLYNEKKLGLGYGIKLNQHLGLGVQLDYWNTFIGNNYGSKSLLTFEVGLLAKVTDNLNLGIHVFNPIRAKLSTYDDERLQSLLKIGLEWAPSEDLIVTAEAQSNIDDKLTLGAGLEYRILEILYARIGMGSKPEIFSFGFGLKMQSFQIDFGSTYHQILGYSPQLSFHYTFDKN